MRLSIAATILLTLTATASAEGLKARWRAYRAGGQVTGLENAITQHHLSVELNGHWTHRDLGRLKSATRSLASTLQAMRDGGQTLAPEHKAKLEALEMPSFRASVEVSRNLWGQEGFDPASVETMEKLTNMGESFSALFKIAGTLGIQMKPMKVRIRMPYGARITRQEPSPGVDLSFDR